MEEERTFGELLESKDYILSTKVEIELYKLLENCGLNKKDIATAKYDKQIGDAKELIYSEFAKALDFDYKWDGFYRLSPK